MIKGLDMDEVRSEIEQNQEQEQYLFLTIWANCLQTVGEQVVYFIYPLRMWRQ